MPLFKEIQLVQFDLLSERVGRRHLSVQISLFLSFLEWIGYVFSAIGIVIQWYRSIYEWGFRDMTPTYDIPFSALSFISVFIRHLLAHLSADWSNLGAGEHRDKRISVLWILISFLWFAMNDIEENQCLKPWRNILWKQK